MSDKNWTISQAESLYNIHSWSEGHVSVNPHGHVVIQPRAEPAQGIDLYEVVQQLKLRHLNLPVLIRFTDILKQRVNKLHQAFLHAIKGNDFRGKYTALYPVKVNQQHSVIDELVGCGIHKVGLEAGSKAELMAVLGLSQTGGTIVCNGYKDREYIRLALMGQQLGQQVFIVIEKYSELALLLNEAEQMAIKPRIGIRVRLASIGAGNWQNSGGEKSKFGLSAGQVLEVISDLKKAKMLDCLVMLHFHLGSQLVDIRDIAKGMTECARFYAELHALGVAIDHVDVGGGLGVDYEGRQNTSACSMNYDIDAYAQQIVSALAAICGENDLPQPHIFTESGRAMTAHHAVLVTNIIERESIGGVEHFHFDEPTVPAVLRKLYEIHNRVKLEAESNVLVALYAQKNAEIEKLQGLYNDGQLSLELRAQMENMALSINRQVQARLSRHSAIHGEILNEINEKMADKYFCNFSLFQSAPDIWGIDQVFPIMPLHRLNEEPVHRAVLEDITCDSDGRIDQFVEGAGIESNLHLHDPGEEEYLIGIFMVGAYQEILGDMHNLFGDTDSVHVELDANSGYRFRELVQGDSVDSVLKYVHINSAVLLENYRAKLSHSDLDGELKQQYLDELNSGLHAYTYLNK